jgi:hypothetical protein
MTGICMLQCLYFFNIKHDHWNSIYFKDFRCFSHALIQLTCMFAIIYKDVWKFVFSVDHEVDWTTQLVCNCQFVITLLEKRLSVAAVVLINWLNRVYDNCIVIGVFITMYDKWPVLGIDDNTIIMVMNAAIDLIMLANIVCVCRRYRNYQPVYSLPSW